MGCPPDPVEVSIWRSGERIQELQERYDRFRAEYADAVKFAEALEILSFEPLSRWPEERFTIRTDVQPDEFNQYADDAAQSALESGYKKQVKSLETALCTLRTELLKRWREKPQRSKVDASLVKQVRAAHAAHRKEDRAQAIKWLKQQREVMEYYVEHPQEPTRMNRQKALTRLTAIDSEIKRLRALKVSDMLYDRGLTEFDERRFAIPFGAE